MHDLSLRIVSAMLTGGVLLFFGFIVYGALYPRRVRAAEPAGPPPAAASRAKGYGMLAPIAQPLE
jgi:hypothetical protein